MKVAKWGNSLAVRLPIALVEALGVREGDDVVMRISEPRTLEVSRDLSREQALLELRAMRRPLPPGFRFDREEANER